MAERKQNINETKAHTHQKIRTNIFFGFTFSRSSIRPDICLLFARNSFCNIVQHTSCHKKQAQFGIFSIILTIGLTMLRAVYLKIQRCHKACLLVCCIYRYNFTRLMLVLGSNFDGTYKIYTLNMH